MDVLASAGIDLVRCRDFHESKDIGWIAILIIGWAWACGNG